MEVPELVDSHLEGERVVSRVDIDGDAVYVTPTRTLLYREEGLLSDESVAAYRHDVDRLEVSEGRRKATFRTRDIEGTREFSVPASRADDVLAPLLWGVLRVKGVLDDGEGIEALYRFSELTLVLTDARIVKHVGTAVWDEEFEQFPYAALTDLAFEEGSVATSLVVEVDGRRERVKTPKEEGRFVRRAVEQAVFDFHDVDSIEAFREKVSPDEDDAEDGDRAGGALGGGSEGAVGGASEGEGGNDTWTNTDADPGARTGGGSGAGTEGGSDAGTEVGSDAGTEVESDAGTDVNTEDRSEGHRELAGVLDESSEISTSADGPAETGNEAGSQGTSAEPAIADRLDAVEAAVQRQNELLEEQRATIDQLIEELKRGR